MYMKGTRAGRILAVVGQYSMEIYVMHMLLVKFILFVPDMVMWEDIFTYSYFMVYAALIVALVILLVRYALGYCRAFRIVTGRK